MLTIFKAHLEQGGHAFTLGGSVVLYQKGSEPLL